MHAHWDGQWHTDSDLRAWFKPGLQNGWEGVAPAEPCAVASFRELRLGGSLALPAIL